MIKMRRGFKCKKEVLEELKRNYDQIIINGYHGNFLEALKNFDLIAENNLRSTLRTHYSNQRSRDQAWKTCKGSLYEYAVFRYIQNIIENNRKLKDKIMVMMGDDASISHRNQIVIRNWSDIFPDVDILIIEKDTNLVIVILSCKTSLRERLTETAFWKRELEKTQDIKLVFVTTDKDNELRTETNRYILLHVVDYTFITDPDKYDELIDAYKRKYGKRKDFNQLLIRVRFIDKIEDFIHYLLNKRGGKYN
ncbi:MAG: BsaWI family type II restriction enzyme [Deltaproteobacteria bacterium]|nr:BsaWI family type II restriction enzyme [Deltaproteobacteria bacterium]